MDSPILYRARYLLPICTPPLEDGSLLVTADGLHAVGSYRELSAAFPTADEVDFGDSVLLPPLVNAHTHLELTDFPAWADAAGETTAPADFVDWILHLVRVRRQASTSQLKVSLASGLQSSLRAGTGAIGDIFTSLKAAGAYRSSPLRGRIFAEVLGHDPAVVNDRLAQIADLLKEPPARELNWGLSPHSPYSLSVSTIDQVFAFADDKGLQCTMHLAESIEESDLLQSGSGNIAARLYATALWDPAAAPTRGRSPVQAMCREGRLRPGDLVVHGVQVSAADIVLLKKHACSVVLCPRSNATLDVGKAPVAAYLAAGVPLALGTDSLASAPSLSIWEELAFASSWFAGQATPRDWLRMATLGGAQALHLYERLGQLSPGHDASFQVISLPALPRLSELEEALCTAGQALRVTHLYLASSNVLPQG
jgi:cytosine/adenosine deaminase-related metal-dependent hydrolase